MALGALNLFPARVPFVDPAGTGLLTREALQSFQQLTNYLNTLLPAAGVPTGGTVDAAPALQVLIDQLNARGGGRLFLPDVYLIDSQLDVKDNVELVGPMLNPDPSISGGTYDFLSQAGRFIVNPAQPIIVRNHSGIFGLTLMRKGLTTGQTPSVDFTGLCINVLGASAVVEECAILGFNAAIEAISPLNGQRPARGRFRRVLFDCNNGINVEQAFDVPYIEECLGNNVTGATTPLRGGTAFRYANVVDWGKWTNCFSYGFQIGFDIDAAFDVIAQGCGTDYQVAPASTSIGYRIGNGSRRAKILGCQAAAQGTGIQIDTPAGGDGRTHVIQGWTSWNLDQHHIHVINGRAIIDGCAISNGAAVGVTLEAGTGGVLSNIGFDVLTTAINDLSAYGSWSKNNLTRGSGTNAGSTTQTYAVPSNGGLHDFGSEAGRHVLIGDPAAAAGLINYLRLRGGITGGRTRVEAQGGDANVILALAALGSSPVIMQTNGADQFAVNGPAGAVNRLRAEGNTAGLSPRIVAEGTDADVDVRAIPKGAGLFGGGTVTASADVPAVGTYLVRDIVTGLPVKLMVAA